MYNTAICLLIKDEGEYLPEWLEWHLKQGFQHFYIYDDSETGPITEYLGEYASYCTVRDAKRYQYHLQFEVYMDCLRRFGEEAKWLAFIDADEFIRTVNGEDINIVLANYENAGAVTAPWLVYNADGQIYQEPGPVRERFHTVVPFIDGMPTWKSIVQPAFVRSMAAHSPTLSTMERKIVDTNGKEFFRGRSEPLPTDKLVVDHYFTKSYEEWIKRLPKGSCDPFSSRRMEWFETLNPGLLEAHGLVLGEPPTKNESGG